MTDGKQLIVRRIFPIKNLYLFFLLRHSDVEDEEEEFFALSYGRGSGFIGPPHLVDDPLPDVLLRVREKLATPPPTMFECEESKEVNWDAFTSTWLSGMTLQRC